jgi:hypothetical protein
MRRLVSATVVMATAIVFSAGQAEELPAPYVIKTFPIADGVDLPDFKIDDTTVSLVGDPESKTFGLSFRGTLSPTIVLQSSNKLAAFLYVNCDDKSPSKTKGTNVGTVIIADFKEGRVKLTLIATADATAFVPLKAIQCVKLGVK